MKRGKNNQKIKEILERGVEEIIEKESLIKKLKSSKKLRIKHGIDPTGPKIHLGRATQFLKLRDFQDLGHQIVLIIGDFTAQIGDASDKTSARPSLSEKEIENNMKEYKKQIGKILDLKKTEIRYNSEWLKKMKIKDLIRLAMNFTAQQMIQRRNFKERWEKKDPIGVHEILYPLFQGYDSVVVKADVEIGGSDQLFNLLAGRKIQELFSQKPQDIMTLKMILGTDKRKMSTTWQNVINILDPPKEQFGKIMSMDDSLILDYFISATRIPIEEINQMEKALKEKKVNPRDLKIKLAKEIVSFFWSKKDAQLAEKEFIQVFKEKKLPSDIKEIELEKDKIHILDLLVKTKMVKSKSEAKRLVIQGGVKINGVLKNNWQEVVQLNDGSVIKIGKRKFAKIKLI